MHTLPDKLHALDAKLEASFIRRLAEQRKALEAQMQERIEAAEQAAVARAGELLGPRISAVEDQVAKDFPAVRKRIEELSASCKADTATLREEHDGELFELRSALGETRAEFQTSTAAAVETAASAVNLKVADLSSAVFGQIDELQKFSVASRKAAEKALSESDASLRVHLSKVHAALDARDGELQDAINAERTRIDSLQERSSRLEDWQGQHKVELRELAKAHAAGEAARSAGHEELRREAKQALEEAATQLRQHTEEVGSCCREVAASAVTELGVQLRDECVETFKELSLATHSLHQDVCLRIEKEAEERQASVAATSRAFEQALEASSQSWHACLTDASAKLATHIEDTHCLLLETGGRVSQLEASLADTSQNLLMTMERLEKVRQEAMQNLEGAQANARDRLEEVRVQFRENLNEEVVRLQAELSRIEDAGSSDVASIRLHMQTLASIEQVQQSVEVAAGAVTANRLLEGRVDELSAALNKQENYFHDGVQDVIARCQNTRADFVDLRSRVQQEVAALGGEISSLRAATGSLTQGVLAGFGTVGLLKSEAEEAAAEGGRGSVVRDVCDLLDWDKAGNPLAARIASSWAEVEKDEAVNLLALVCQKANEVDLRAVLSTAVRMHADSSRPWSSAPVVGDFATAPLVMRHGPRGDVSMVRDWSLTPTPPQFAPHHSVAPRSGAKSLIA